MSETPAPQTTTLLTQPTPPNTTKPPRTLKNGVVAHELTLADRQRGARRANEVRREKAKSHGQRMREQVEKKERAMNAAMIDKALEGNVQAYLALMAYSYGTPAKVEPDEVDVSVTDADGPRGVNLGVLVELAKKTGIDVPDAANTG